MQKYWKTKRKKINPMKKMNNTTMKLKQIIDQCNNLLIISHILPDGDNIGSVIAMMHMLKNRGKTVTAVVNGEMPPYYRFLDGATDLVTRDQLPASSWDGVLCLDMSDRQRGGEVWEKIKATPVILNIDHHVSNDYFGDYNYVESEASSTAEIVTSLMTEWNVPITKAIAEALYTGIVTDSGSFTYPSTSSHTMEMAAILLRQNIDLEAIRENVLENVSFLRKKLLANVLNHAILSEDGKLCYAAIGYDEITSLGAKGPDFENIIDHLIGVTGVEYAVFFREIEPESVKIGFRGRGNNDVTVVASHFGGGGHKAAAGCSCKGTLTTVVTDVIADVTRYLEES